MTNKIITFLLCLAAGIIPCGGQTTSVTGDLRLYHVPVGSVATRKIEVPLLNGMPDTDFLPLIGGLSNNTSGLTASLSADWTGIDSTVTTQNRAPFTFLNGGSNSTGVLKDALTITDSSPGSFRRLTVEYEIRGEFTVTNSIFTGDEFNRMIDGVAAMTVRLQGSLGVSLEEIRSELAGDLLQAVGGPTPRTVTGTFPFYIAGSTFVTFGAGQTVNLRAEGAALLSYQSDAFQGAEPDDDGVSFAPLSGVGALACSSRARITRMALETTGGDPLINPLITSASGFDYNGLLTPPPPFVVTGIEANAAGTMVALTWNSSGRSNFFRVRSATDLSTAPGSWPIVRSSISNAGPTTSTSLTISPGMRFYVVEEE